MNISASQASFLREKQPNEEDAENNVMIVENPNKTRHSMIYRAVRAGDLDYLEEILTDSPELNLNDVLYYRENLLMLAIKFKQVAMAAYLLEKGVDPTFEAIRVTRHINENLLKTDPEEGESLLTVLPSVRRFAEKCDPDFAGSDVEWVRLEPVTPRDMARDRGMDELVEEMDRLIELRRHGTLPKNVTTYPDVYVHSKPPERRITVKVRQPVFTDGYHLRQLFGFDQNAAIAGAAAAAAEKARAAARAAAKEHHHRRLQFVGDAAATAGSHPEMRDFRRDQMKKYLGHDGFWAQQKRYRLEKDSEMEKQPTAAQRVASSKTDGAQPTAAPTKLVRRPESEPASLPSRTSQLTWLKRPAPPAGASKTSSRTSVGLGGMRKSKVESLAHLFRPVVSPATKTSYTLSHSHRPCRRLRPSYFS